MATLKPAGTGDLFLDYEPEAVVVGLAPGQLQGGQIASRISRAVSMALKKTDKSRSDVAQLMGDILGAPVSLGMLDNYASEAKEGHKITLERFLVLIEVTGATELVGFVAERFDLVAVPKRYRAIIELHQLEEAQQRLALRKAAVQALIRRRT